MKIIDLLNKIAKGEEVPREIRYENDIYILLDNYCYFCEETNSLLSYRIFAEQSRLNEEVEIIEEDKKIEKIKKIKSLNNVGDCPNLVEFGDKQQLNNHILKDKINEIIKEINKLKDDRK